MIKNILFDMGSTLIRFEPETFIRLAGITDPADRSALLWEVYRSAEWVALDRGAITEDQAEAAMCRRLPERLHAVAGRLIRHWDRPLLVVEGMEELVEELSELGCGLYLLTNAGPRHHEYWPRFPVSRFFPEERIFRSSDYLLLKPEREFYDKALATLGLDAAECVFIDDSPPNAESAIRCGIDTVIFRGDAAHLRSALRARGIPVKEA